MENMTVNKSGGKAFAFDAKHQLAQFISTGFIGRTVNFSNKEKDVLKNLLTQVDPEFIAKTCVYARQCAYMKDTPAFMCAYLASIGRNDLLQKVWHKVMDSPKMVRNFVNFIRSGIFGRKSLGSRPKKLVQQWICSKSPMQLFRNSIGASPSMADLIRMAHPKPNSPEQEQMFKYLLGCEYNAELLPREVVDYELMKKSSCEKLPNVPFEMLTSQKLSNEQWQELAAKSSWSQIRQNLNTFNRHEVFNNKELVKELADKLSRRDLVLGAKAMPYQLYTTYLNTKDIPIEISQALKTAVLHSLENVSSIDKKIHIFLDVSGSMHSGMRENSSIKILEVAALFASALMLKNNDVTLVPFDTTCHTLNIDLASLDLFEIAEKLADYGGGGTALSVPMKQLADSGERTDLVIYLSDNESWADSQWRSGIRSGTSTSQYWENVKKVNPSAKLICIDLVPRETTQAKDSEDTLNIGGFSDQIFDVITNFANGNSTSWVEAISNIEI